MHEEADTEEAKLHLRRRAQPMRMLLIADPQTLGQIRPTLHKEVQNRLVSEETKTHESVHHRDSERVDLVRCHPLTKALIANPQLWCSSSVMTLGIAVGRRSEPNLGHVKHGKIM